ncbi:MAG: chromosome segregation protein SMC [Rhodospirillaceae bacterium]|nr:chromosome segregation protein SMC [Rhodospirillaceae bacterium]
MHFNRLRLTGFKSFVEPTELPIETGITGIVGPNGCGKSNIVEALRWVMGETSAKRMRGSEMDDVIFGGSTNRPARNIAEVMLLLDNEDRGAPAQFNDTDLLEISRRIERGSGSQYRVNGNDVRARDVQLLFADLASGAHSTAMVSQGRVGALIGAKPVERRALLEEAAGITGLHSRRHEAELRLKAAETNLERLDDVIGALQGQRQGLQRQARQAKRYRRLADQIREKEAVLLHLRWMEAVAAKDVATAKLDEAEKSVADRTEAAATAARRQADAQSALPALRDAAAKAAAELQRLTMAAQELDNEEARISAAEAEIARRLEQIGGDIERETELAEEAAAAIKRLEMERAKIAEAQTGEADAMTAAKAALAEANQALTAKESELAKLTQDVAAAEAKQAALERQSQEVSDRIARLEARAGQIEQERQALAEKISADQRLAETERNITAAESALAEARNELQQAEAARSEMESAETSKRAEASDAKSARSEIAAEIKALIEILGEPDSDLFPPLIDALEVDAGYETALATALGEDLTAPIDEAAERHWASLGPLADAPALPAGVTSLAQFVKGPQALERRLGSIGVVDDDESGTNLRNQLRPGQRLVSKSGAFWRWDGFTVAAGVPSAAATRLSQRNRLAELGETLKSADARFNDAESQHRAAVDALTQANETEKGKRRAVEALFGQLDGARDAHASLMSEASGAASRLTALEETAAEVASDLERTRALETEVAEALASAPEPVEARASIDTLRAAVAEHRAQGSERQSRFDRLEAESELRRERLKTCEAEIATWQERTAGAASRLEDLTSRKTEIESQAQSLSKRPAEIAEQRKKLLALTETSEQSQQEASDALAAGESEQADADQLSKAAEAALGEAREDRVRRQGLVEQADQDCTAVAERIREKLNCAPEDTLAQAGLEPESELPKRLMVETEIDKLTRSRDAIGPVNLRAETELEEIDERIETMNMEREDLLAAISRLRQGISSLNREGRERLLAAFEEVKAHFEELFVRLFGGGRAYIQLTEADDPLEAGLEVMASPPGKKLQVMSLLSGGEQALAALALLFAVFLTNPAPICVLDEVDAPLDDANVDRFCTLLEEIAHAGTTRFLCVTHHRMTMARMDRLFGVTMGERGVSQLVSVDLRRAEELRDSA